MGQHLCTNKQPRQNSEMGDLNCGTLLPSSEFESQKNYLVCQNSSALLNPFSLNPKDPKGKMDCGGKIHLAANRKASYIKISTIHFQTIPAPL